MGKNTTTIERALHPAAHDIARKYEKRFGSLKTALSMGMLALDKLSAGERERLLDLVTSSGVPEQTATKERVKALRRATEHVRQLKHRSEAVPGIKVLSKEDSAALDELRKELEPPEIPDTARKRPKGVG